MNSQLNSLNRRPKRLLRELNSQGATWKLGMMPKFRNYSNSIMYMDHNGNWYQWSYLIGINWIIVGQQTQLKIDSILWSGICSRIFSIIIHSSPLAFLMKYHPKLYLGSMKEDKVTNSLIIEFLPFINLAKTMLQ